MGDEISLEGKDPDAGDFLKWIFSETKQDSFTWPEERSKDGVKWVLTERMLIRRRVSFPT